MEASLPGEGAGGHWPGFVPCSPGTVSSLLQPSLDPLPPYILAEAQLRSQRYCPLCWGGRGVARRGPSRSRFPPCGFPRAEAEQIQEYLLEDREDEDARPGES